MSGLLIGIDGGGTSCRAAVADATGRILGRGKSGAANILTDPDTALRHIVEAASLALADGGLLFDELARASAILGVAGNNVGEAARYVLERLPFARSAIESDGLIALQGALGDEDGGVAILGTGSIFITRKAGTVSYIGGWGFIVGDLGSGARIGHALLQECLLSHDGIHPSSPLTEDTLAAFRNDPREIVEFARQAKPGDFGRYAPQVFDYAGRGDIIGRNILQTAALAVDETLDRIVADGCERLCLLGGLSGLYVPWIAERHRKRLAEPKADALTGAVALAVARFTTEEEAAG